MATSSRAAALLDLKSAMGNISVVNGYATDVGAVIDYFIDWTNSPPASALPAIAVVPLDAQYEHLSVRNTTCVGVRVRQLVAVEFCYRAATTALVWSVGDALIDDVIAAAMVDRTRGGNAMDTRVVSAETDAGNADTQDSHGGTAAGIVRFELDLMRTLGVS